MHASAGVVGVVKGILSTNHSFHFLLEVLSPIASFNISIMHNW